MGLANILKFCGMADNREAHNALEDAIQQAKEFEAVLSIMKINAHGPTKAT